MKNKEPKAVAQKEEKTAIAAKPTIKAAPEPKATPAGNGQGPVTKNDKIATQQEQKEAKAAAQQEKKQSRIAAKKDLKVARIAKQAAKKEANAAGKDKGLGGIAKIFDKFDKMINKLEKKLDDIDEKMAKDKSKGFGDFIDGLNKAFAPKERTEENSFVKNIKKIREANSASDTHKLGMAQVKKDTLDHLFNGGEKNTSFGINRVGDSGEGSGNFSATKFMSSVSNNINEGLDNYKKVKESAEEKGEKGIMDVKEENQLNVKTELSAVA